MIYYITHENSFKFILKFCFLFEVLSPAFFPPMKISKIPLSPSFSPQRSLHFTDLWENEDSAEFGI